MGRVTVTGRTLAGVAAAVRLARVGHEVTLVESPGEGAALRAQLGATLGFPAPWRDLFKKSGRPTAGALGLHGLDLVPDPEGPPTDRAAVWYADVEAHGEPVATAWRDLVDAADDAWQSVRPLGVEAELTPDAVARAALSPRRSLADVAATLPHPDLAHRVRRLADDHRVAPDSAPAWLVSRLSVERTFGRWRLVDAAGTPQPASALVDVLDDRLAERGVRVVATDPGDAQAHVQTRDPGVRWRRPPRWGRRGTFTAQLLARPSLRDPAGPGRFHASASSPAGPEPWAQLLSGALAAYAVHEHLTGEDIRPTNKSLAR
ncbi:MAG: hypothetical protein Q4F65_03250 [Propionibacteriaceae bacterium]|nr:hypothetical protein [Propionibacteriaceae bacterium]